MVRAWADQVARQDEALGTGIVQLRRAQGAAGVIAAGDEDAPVEQARAAVIRALDVQGRAADDLREGREAACQHDRTEQHAAADDADPSCAATAPLRGGACGFTHLPECHHLSHRAKSSRPPGVSGIGRVRVA